MISRIVLMMCHFLAFCDYRSFHRQPRGVVVFIPLGNSPDHGQDKHSDYQREHQKKHYFKTATHKKSHGPALLLITSVHAS